MLMKALMKSVVVAAVFALGLGMGQAQADIALSGDVSNVVYNSSDGTLQLSGPSITVSPGEEVVATITLNQNFTIPASASTPGSYTWFSLLIQNPSNPTGNTGTTQTISFFNNGSPVASGSAGTTTSDQLNPAVVFFFPNNGAITFNSFTTDFTVTARYAQDNVTPLSTDTFTSAQMYYSLNNAPVPIPGTAWLLGSGLVGLIGIKRKYLG